MKTQRRILIVEDDTIQLKRYLDMAKRAGLGADGVDSLDKAMAYLSQVSYQFVLTDIHLSGTGKQDSFEGFKILKSIRANHPETIPLAMSADPQINTYNKALKEGAAHFFRKPILSESELLIHLDVATKGRSRKLKGASASLPAHLQKSCPDGLVLSEALRSRIQKAAISDGIPIILLGETGTGKEEVAKLLHKTRSEAAGHVPFVAINCANLSGDAAISTLFGHRKGAFTGAEETTVGYVGEADGGFLFLDEIHTLSLDCQKRLLRVLNDGSYTRLGDTQTLYSDFQVIVATTKDLDDEVEKGNFLLDLRGRLTGIQIQLPPLRERLDDFSLLVQLGFARHGIQLDPETLSQLVTRCQSFYWQGNVRQLFQVLNILATEAMGDASQIKVEDLPVLKTMLPPGKTAAKEPLIDDILKQLILKNMVQIEDLSKAIARLQTADPI